MSFNAITPHSIYGETTLVDASTQVVSLVYDGATVSSIPIPSGRLVISDLLFGIGFVYWAVEVDRGSGFVPIATFGFVITSPIHNEIKKLKTGIVIEGGPGVAMRMTATAISPPVTVNVTLRAYTES